MKSPYVSVILPTCNERENVQRLVPNIITTLNTAHISCEIILVDDDSTDGSDEVFDTLKTTYKNVRVYVRKGKRGLGTAIGYGIGKAHGTIIVGMDADGNHPVDLVPALLNELKFHKLVIASRFIAGGGMENKKRYWLSFIANIVLRFILGVGMSDCTSGFYAIRRKDLLSLGIDRIYHGYGDYHLRLVYFAHRVGLASVEIPVVYGARSYGVSKSRMVHMMFGYIYEALKVRL